MHTNRGRRLDAWLCSVDALLHEALLHEPVAADSEEPVLLEKLWTEYVQLVDVVPSTGRPGQAVLIEGRLLGLVLEHLGALHRYRRGSVPAA